MAWRDLPGFLVLVRPDGDVTIAEGSAGEIWRRLSGVVTFDELVEGLAQEYGVGPETIAPAVDAFVSELLSKELARSV